MAIVVDASAIVPLALDDEDAAFAEAVLHTILAEGALAPAIFWYEIRNVLLQGERRGRVPGQRIDAFLADVETLSLTIEPPANSEAVLNLARQFNLSIYDAAYLELALRTGSRLATQDQQLRTAFAAAGGRLFEIEAK